MNPSARIALAYAEFRDVATDYGFSHPSDTPLMYLERFIDDDEHTELAWLVTRVLWGDLQDDAEPRARRCRRGTLPVACAAASVPRSPRPCDSSPQCHACHCETPSPRSQRHARFGRKGGRPRCHCCLGRQLSRLAALLVFGSACVKQNDPGVGLVKFDSSAVFGIAPKEEPVVAGFELPTDLAELPDVSRPITPLRPRVDEGPCPEAKLTAFPARASTVKVDGLPTEGLYRWKRPLLTLKNSAATPPLLKGYPFTLQSRAIRRVVKEGDHQFSFEMVAPSTLSENRTTITSFRVNTNEQLVVDRRVDSRTIGVVNVPGTDVRVANPSDAPGIFITAIEEQDPQGVRLSRFEPVQPMLVVPLEGGLIRSGQAFRSVGIDATSGSAITNDGIVGRTSRVDACGEIVEGYAVTLHQTLTDDSAHYPSPVDAGATAATQGETREITYNFATQYGALPIAETLSIGDVNVDDYAALAKLELGGLTPKPLPDSLK